MVLPDTDSSRSLASLGPQQMMLDMPLTMMKIVQGTIALSRCSGLGNDLLA